MTGSAFLLGKTIRPLPDKNGELRTADGYQPTDPAAVERYLVEVVRRPPRRGQDCDGIAAGAV